MEIRWDTARLLELAASANSPDSATRWLKRRADTVMINGKRLQLRGGQEG
jgi:hypothetical protein